MIALPVGTKVYLACGATDGGTALHAVTLAQGGRVVFLAQVWTTASN